MTYTKVNYARNAFQPPQCYSYIRKCDATLYALEDIKELYNSPITFDP